MDIYDIIDDPSKQIELFNSILKKMNSSSDYEEVLVNIISEIKSIMSIDSILLYVIDNELYNLNFEMSIGPLSKKFVGHTIDFENPLAIRALLTSNALYSNELIDEYTIFNPIKKILDKELKNILFVPLKIQNKNIASLFLLNKKNGKFIEKDTNVIFFFANIVSLALSTKMNYNIIQSRAYEISALYQLSASINRFDTMREVLNDNLSIICEAFECERVSIILKENGEYKFQAGIGIDEDIIENGVVTIDNNVLSEVLKTSKSVYSRNVSTDLKFRPNKYLRYEKESFIVSPIILNDEIIGFLSATEKSNDKSFTFSNLMLLEMFAEQIADNYRNIIILEDMRNKNSLEYKMEYTEEFQKSMLPLDFPNDNLFDISAINDPAKHVGGDFYDYIKIDDSKYAIVLADASENGLEVCLFMYMIRAVLRVHLSDILDPALVLKKANENIVQNSKKTIYATCFLMIVDTKCKTITYSNAGHIPQYFVKSATYNIEDLYIKSKPLGFVSEANYESRSIFYSENDYILLFTDGIINSFNPLGYTFGVDRIKEILKEKYSSSKDILDSIIEANKDFREYAPLFDDITLLVTRFL